MSLPPLPADVHDLRADGWDRRVPTLVLTLGPPVVAVLAVASVWNEPAVYSGDVAEVSSWSWFLVGIPIGVALAAVLIGWFAPRPGAWAMAVGVFPPLFSEGSDGSGEWFALVGWAWLAVVALDLVLVLRQRALVASTTPAPPATGARPWRADHHLLVRGALAAVVTAGIAVGFTQYAGWRSDVRALADRAVPTALPVSRVDTAFDSVFVEVDGREREFFVADAAEHPVGSTFVVYVDPTGAMPPYGAEDADPSGWSDMGVPIGAGLLLLVVVGPEVGRRRRRVEALASADDAGVPVLIRLHPLHDGIEVFADTDPEGLRPLAYLPTLEVLLRRDAPLPRWIDDDREEYPGLVGESLQPARVVGLVSDGSLCVLRTAAPDGDVAVLASVRPARDRWTLRTVAFRLGNRVLGDRVAGRLSGHGERDRPSEEGHDLEPGSTPALVRRLLLGARLAAPVGVAALLVLGLVALPWLNEGEPAGPEAFLLAVPAGSLAAWWWGLRRDRVLPSRWGLRLTSTWLDQLVLPAEITEVRRLGHGVVIELGEDEQFELGPDPLLDEHAQQQELDQLVRAVDGARQRARDGLFDRWESNWPRRLPSVTTVVGLVVFAVWAIAGLRG